MNVKKEGKRMVTGYNLHLDKNTSEFQSYIKCGESHLSEQKAKISDCLQNYIINGIADGTRLGKEWFPEIEADIFISHSHADEKLAKGRAGWLHSTFGLNCFIDSCVWGYSDKLLENINDEYSDKQVKKEGGYVYNHEKCNTASKHVNTMLTIALYKMIDKTEVTFLLNTDNVISKYADVYQQATYSPWIYSEIICTEIVRKKPISQYRDKDGLMHFFEKSELGNDGFSAAYEVSLEHLNELDMQCLLEWKNLYEKHKVKYPLDSLYKLTYEEETRNIPIDLLYS